MKEEIQKKIRENLDEVNKKGEWSQRDIKRANQDDLRSAMAKNNNLKHIGYGNYKNSKGEVFKYNYKMDKFDKTNQNVEPDIETDIRTVTLFNPKSEKHEIVFVGPKDEATSKYKELFKKHQENVGIKTGDWRK